MNGMTIHTLARQLALPTSRRASLLALGAPGLAVMTGFSPVTEAKKKRKNNKKKDDKKCKRQVGECCEFLGACQAEGFIDCLMTLMRPPRPGDEPVR
jgi:hypothetical protein